MKRFLSLLLCLCFVLSGCGAQENQTADSPAPQKVTYSAYALAEGSLPDLPAEPSEAEWEKFFEENDYDKLGQEEYEEAYNAFEEDWSARYDAYREAMTALRGDDLVSDYAPQTAFADFTVNTASTLFAGAGTDNLIYSPANLYLALSMLTAVTDGESRAQVLSLLGLASGEQAAQTANALWRKLYQMSASGETLLANSLWLREGTEYNIDTLKALAENYYASAYSVPMGTEEADAALQCWLNDNTGGLLKDAVGGLKTEPETVLALVSALYFKDQWLDEFSESSTRKDTFTAADGREQTVDFMHLTQDCAEFFRDEQGGYTVARLHFQNGSAMRFLLPDEGVTLEGLLDSGAAVGGLQVYDMGVCLQTAKVNWSVPKFDVSSNLDLCDTLKALGVTDVFDGGASDFTPLGTFENPLAVSGVRHAVRVKVDEQGCEAAAFTAMMIAESVAMPEELPEIDMNLNRPFVFAVTGVNGLPLFLGTVHTMEA